VDGSLMASCKKCWCFTKKNGIHFGKIRSNIR
jgi:hypothetical protein